MTTKAVKRLGTAEKSYASIFGDISRVIEAARISAARSVNFFMTAAYWLIGRRIVECEQEGRARAEYGEQLLERLSVDLGKRYGRGFGVVNLSQMKKFYLLWPPNIFQTPSEKSRVGPIPRVSSEIFQAMSAEIPIAEITQCFPLPWSAYVRLLGVKNDNARRFYEAEALRGGWSVRQLDRQINSQLCAGTLDPRERESACRPDSLRPEGRGSGALRPRPAPQQGSGRGVPDGPAGREGTG